MKKRRLYIYFFFMVPFLFIIIGYAINARTINHRNMYIQASMSKPAIVSENEFLQLRADQFLRKKVLISDHKRYFNSVAEMKQSTILNKGDCVITTGYYSANDGGGGRYLITDSSTTEDGGSVHTLQNGLKAEMDIRRSVSVRQFGAKGDGITDDQPALQMCFSKCKNIYIGEGIYRIDVNNKTIHILSDTTLKMAQNAVLKAIPNHLSGYFLLTASYTESNIVIDGGVLEGDKYEHDYTNNGVLVEGNHALLYIAGAKNVTVKNMEIRESPGMGVILINAGGAGAITNESYRNKNITIDNCYIHDHHACGLVIQGGDQIRITNNVISDTVMHPNFKTPGTIEMGLDVEGQSGVTDLIIDGNTFFGSTNFGLQVFGGYPAKRVTISNNIIKDGMFIFAVDQNGIPYEDMVITNCIVKKEHRSYEYTQQDYFGMTFLYTGDNGKISNLTCSGYAQINGSLSNVDVSNCTFDYFKCTGMFDYVNGNVKIANIKVKKNLILNGVNELIVKDITTHGTVEIGLNSKVTMDTLFMLADDERNINPLPSLYLTNNKKVHIRRLYATSSVPNANSSYFMQVLQNIVGTTEIENSYIKLPVLKIHGPTFPGSILQIDNCDFSDCGEYFTYNLTNTYECDLPTMQ